MKALPERKAVSISRLMPGIKFNSLAVRAIRNTPNTLLNSMNPLEAKPDSMALVLTSTSENAKGKFTMPKVMMVKSRELTGELKKDQRWAISRMTN